MVARSDKMKQLFALVRKVAPSDASVLIQGENGTGKELVANAIHQPQQARRRAVRQDQLRGHPVRADRVGDLRPQARLVHRRAGRPRRAILELADGGSLLLDEIGEMPAALQVKLLRVLQEREFTPVGGSRPFKSNFRLICATNIDLDAALADKKLRAGPVLPHQHLHADDPAAARSHDRHPAAGRVPAGQARGAASARRRRALPPTRCRPLQRHRWPGNVRELEHAIERAVIVATGPGDPGRDLPSTVREPMPDETALEAIPQHARCRRSSGWRSCARSSGRSWNKRATADILGVYRPTLYSKLKKYNLLKRPMSGERLAGARPPPSLC